PQTVNNWLSTSRGIPAKAQIIISALMKADEAFARQQSALPQNLVLNFTRKQFDRIQDCAIAQGKRINEWAQSELLKLAEEDLKAVEARLKVAERPGSYTRSKSKTPTRQT